VPFVLCMATLTAGDDGASDTAGAAQGHLGGHVDVGHVLVLKLGIRSQCMSHMQFVRGRTYLAEKREVEENGQGRSVGGQDYQFRNL
jgi:hypothetical protein